MNISKTMPSALLLLGVFLTAGCSGGGDTPPAITTPPSNPSLMAIAGPDQSVFLGTFVTLDGSNSTNANGTSLTYTWTLQKPVGSAAALSNPAAVNPTFTTDIGGTYEAILVVNDGPLRSAPDTVLVLAASTNPPPVANAGVDQATLAGRPVRLNGDGSKDANGDRLGFWWEVAGKPAGSTLTTDQILHRDTAAPTFTPDVLGRYEIRLVVNDGTSDSPPDSVVITAENTPAPTADAGPNQSVAPTLNVPTQVTLNGSGSHTDPPGEQLNFSWLIQPQGSSPQPSAQTGLNTATPTFMIAANKSGTYVATLTVTEPNHPDPTRRTKTDSVLITVFPKAEAGVDQTVQVDSQVQLNGSASIGVGLTYSWTLSFGNVGLTPSSNTVNFTFTAGLLGTYTATLTVTDSFGNKHFDSVSITSKKGALVKDVTLPAFRSPFTAEQSEGTEGKDLVLSTANSWTFPGERFIRPGIPPTISATASLSDVVGPPSCTWTSSNPAAVEIVKAGTSCTTSSASTTINAKAAGVYTITFIVEFSKDGIDYRTPQDFTIKVATPPAIVVTSPADNLGICSKYGLTGTASNGVTWKLDPPTPLSKVNTVNLSIRTSTSGAGPTFESSELPNPAYFDEKASSPSFIPDFNGTYTVSLTDSTQITSQISITPPNTYAATPNVIDGRAMIKTFYSTNCFLCHSLDNQGILRKVPPTVAGPDHSNLGLHVDLKFDGAGSSYPTYHEAQDANATQRHDLCVFFNE